MKLNIDANPGSSELDTDPHENGPHNNLNSFKGVFNLTLKKKGRTPAILPLYFTIMISDKKIISLFSGVPV